MADLEFAISTTRSIQYHAYGQYIHTHTCKPNVCIYIRDMHTVCCHRSLAVHRFSQTSTASGAITKFSRCAPIIHAGYICIYDERSLKVFREDIFQVKGALAFFPHTYNILVMQLSRKSIPRAVVSVYIFSKTDPLSLAFLFIALCPQ